MKLSFISIISLLAFMLNGAAPEGTIFREAEDFKTIGNGWNVMPHSNSGYTGMPSGGKLVRGAQAAMGALSDNFNIEKAGNYKLHLRYLDLGSPSMRKEIAFKVTIIQNGKTVAEQIFDDGDSIRSTPEGEKKWGTGWARFVWETVDCPLEKGAFTVTFSKVHLRDTTALARNIDCVIITPDTGYVPDVRDFQKNYYARVRAGVNQIEPMAIHLYGWGGAHHNITVKGLFKGVYTGLNRNDYFKAGSVSPFFRINPLVNLGQEVRYSFDAVHSYGKPLDNTHFIIDFSTTPDESGIYKSVERSGSGSGMLLLIKNDGEVRFETDVEESRLDLQRAKATKPAPGRRPVRFPVATSLAINTTNSDEVRRNELEALAALGLSSIAFAPVEICRQGLDQYGFSFVESNCFLFSQTNPKNCYGSPDTAGMERSIARHIESLRKYDLADRVTFISWMDEPGYGLKHVLECPACIAKFPEYLKSQGLTAEYLGVASLEGAKPSNDQKNPRLYYWTLRFYTSNLTGMYRIPTELLAKHLPRMKTAANFGTEIVDSMVSHGNDWFDIYDSGALTFGWTEDWLNLFGTYQLCAFQTAAMRMVTTPNQREFGMYDILRERSGGEIKAKAFSHLGSGAKSLSFFSYGPHYTNGDNDNRNPNTLQAIRDITHVIGARENLLLASAPVRGDAAMLFSRTSDYWNYEASRAGGNPFGQERSMLFLLLLHSGIRPDLVAEDRLAEDLKHYNTLFAVDSHIGAENFETIKLWVEKGGVLYLGAGALARDRYNASLPPLFKRSILEKVPLTQKYLIQNLHSLKPSGTVSFQGGALPLILGSQSLGEGRQLAKSGNASLLAVIPYGRGKIIASGFFPGLSYAKEARKTNKSMPNCWTDYPQSGRALMRLILRETGIQPQITVNNYLIEGRLLASPKGSLLVLANWNGEPKNVTVSVKGNFRTVEGIRCKISGVSSTNGQITFQAELSDGDILQLK